MCRSSLPVSKPLSSFDRRNPQTVARSSAVRVSLASLPLSVILFRARKSHLSFQSGGTWEDGGESMIKSEFEHFPFGREIDTTHTHTHSLSPRHTRTRSLRYRKFATRMHTTDRWVAHFLSMCRCDFSRRTACTFFDDC